MDSRRTVKVMSQLSCHLNSLHSTHATHSIDTIAIASCGRPKKYQHQREDVGTVSIYHVNGVSFSFHKFDKVVFLQIRA